MAAAVAGRAQLDISLELEGVWTISRRLQGIAAAAEDLSPAWPEVDKVLRIVVQQQFATEGQHGGVPWPMLAASTQRQRERLSTTRSLAIGPGHPILRRTNRLADSLTGVTGDSVTIHEAQRYGFGSAVPYLKYHQSRRPRTKIPFRPVLELTADDKNEIFRPIRLHLTGQDPSRTARQDARLRATFAAGPGG